MSLSRKRKYDGTSEESPKKKQTTETSIHEQHIANLKNDLNELTRICEIKDKNSQYKKRHYFIEKFKNTEHSKYLKQNFKKFSNLELMDIIKKIINTKAHKMLDYIARNTALLGHVCTIASKSNTKELLQLIDLAYPIGKKGFGGSQSTGKITLITELNKSLSQDISYDSDDDMPLIKNDNKSTTEKQDISYDSEDDIPLIGNHKKTEVEQEVKSDSRFILSKEIKPLPKSSQAVISSLLRISIPSSSENIHANYPFTPTTPLQFSVGEPAPLDKPLDLSSATLSSNSEWDDINELLSMNQGSDQSDFFQSPNSVNHLAPALLDPPKNSDWCDNSLFSPLFIGSAHPKMSADLDDNLALKF